MNGMIPINNSDTAWLITADWNQENDKFHEELREDILNPEVNLWTYEYRLGGMGVGGHVNGHVGGGLLDIFDIDSGDVGTGVEIRGYINVGGFADGQFVGGKSPD